MANPDSRETGRAELRPPDMPSLCARYFPTCCSYHKGWDDGWRYYAEHVLGPPVTMEQLREAIEGGPDA